MEIITTASGVKILDTTPLGDAGQALNDNFVLLGNRTMTYIHQQTAAAKVWVIQHNLGRPVSVMLADDNGEVFYGDLAIIDLNTVRRNFSVAVSGKAYVS